MVNFRIRKRFEGGGFSSIIRRIWEVSTAYGFSTKKFVKKLKEYDEIMGKHNVGPSFAVTGAVLERNQQVFTWLKEKGADLLVQAYYHLDYSKTNPRRQAEDVRNAISVFNKHKIPFTGFRAPYLDYSKETHKILSKYFKYDSSEKFLWECALRITAQKSSNSFISIPYVNDGLLEIPVSLPSDIWLLHRFGVTDQQNIYSIWENALDCSYERGELFTLQLHPENIFKCCKALDELLSYARAKSPPVWVARLSEIAGWWIERGGHSLEREEGEKHKITVDCSERATLLVKNMEVSGSRAWFDGYRVVDSTDFSVGVNPAIGVSKNASEALKTYLSDEGFIVEESTRKKAYGLYFDDEEFAENDKLQFVEKIEHSGKPYVRLWRWPDKARSVLSLSGDIDCVTLWDYILRAFGR